MMNSRRPVSPVTWTLLAVLLSPIAELLTGRPEAYIFALLAVFVASWVVNRLSPREIGFRFGRLSGYLPALAYPLLVMGPITAIAVLTGRADIGAAWTQETLRGVLLMGSVTAVGVLITEDGVFRGTLWGILGRTELRPNAILIWTSVAFALWHLPVPIIEADFRLPAVVIPVYIANVLLIGLNWGVMRLATGSVLVPALSHGVWNGIAYELFGYGEKSGALGMTDWALLGPERGLLGILLNLCALWLFWKYYRLGAAGRPGERTEPVNG